MKLSEYLETEKESIADFSRRSGIKYVTVWRIIKDPEYFPRAPVMRLVKAHTGNRVKADDFLS